MSWWLSGLFLKLAGEAGELYNPNNQFQTAEPNQAGWRVTLKLSVKLGDDPPRPPQRVGASTSSPWGGGGLGGVDSQTLCALSAGCLVRGRSWGSGAGHLATQASTGRPDTRTLCTCKCALCLSQGLILIWVIFPLIITSNYSIH